MTNLRPLLLAALTSAGLVFSGSAQAQNLLVNGDFEAGGFPDGYNMSVTVPGWQVSTIWGNGMTLYPTSNVVGVGGPSPSSWLFPNYDATGGSGLRHYLDTLGNSHVWQYFTAPCSGSAQVSMAYSLRSGYSSATNRFSLSHHSGLGPVLPALAQTNWQLSSAMRPDLLALDQEQTYTDQTITPPQSGNAWQVFNYTEQLTAGQLYTFMVLLDDRSNLDNASVVMNCPTLPPLDTQETSIQKICQAPTQGTHNGQLGQLWACRIEVETAPSPFAGTLTVNDAPSQNTGNTATQIISMTSGEAGVDCSAGQSCAVDGAVFDGDGTINVQAFVATTGEAPSYSAQNCASGTYTNDGNATAIEGNCVQASFTPSVSTTKICDPVAAVVSGPMTLNCRISVSGSNLPSNGYVAVADIFGSLNGSANVVGQMMNVTSNENWTCADLNGLPNAGLCELPTLDLFNAGGSSTLNVSFQFTVGEGTTQVFNCAPNRIMAVSPLSVMGQQRSDKSDAPKTPPLPDFCTAIDVPKPKLPPLEEAKVIKECGRPEEGEIKGTAGLIWKCRITVSAAPVPFADSFTLTEDASGFNGAGQGNIVSLDPDNPAWQCQQNLPAQTSSCEIAGTDFSLTGTEIVDVTLFTQPQGEGVEWKNCVGGLYRPVKGQDKLTEFEGNCEEMTWKPVDEPGEETTFDVTKVCEPKGNRHEFKPGSWVQPYRCAITVTTNGVPFTHPILVQDDLQFGSNPAWQAITGLSSTDPWSCSPNLPTTQNAPWCIINGNQFPHSTGSSTINVDLLMSSAAVATGANNCANLFAIDPKGGDPKPLAENCTTIFDKPNDDPEPKPFLNVGKVCAQPTRNGAAWNVACVVTISGGNMPAGMPIRLSDEMASVANYAATSGQLQANGIQCNSGPAQSGGVTSFCDLTSDDLANGPITFNFTGTFVSQTALAAPRTAQNCVFADAPSLNLHAPTSGNGKFCVPLQLGNVIIAGPGKPIPFDEKPNLSITKKQAGACVAGTPCRFDFLIENTGNTTMTVPQIVDTMSPATGVTFASASAPFVCSSSNGRIVCDPTTQIALAPGASHTMSLQLVLPWNAKVRYQNCTALQWLPFEISVGDRSARAVQQALVNKGYNPGAVDGAMGPNTRNALRLFQQQNGLGTTGELDEATAAVLFGSAAQLVKGDSDSSDDRSCVGVEYKPGEPEHSRRDSRLEEHNTYKSLLVTFHRTYSSSEHDRKRTGAVHNRTKSREEEHDTRISRVHEKYRSNQHNARTTRIVEEHDRAKSREAQHDRRLSRFHGRFKSSEHDARTTRRIVTHSKSKSAMDEFHRRYKSDQHDGRTTRLRHDRARSRLAEFHRKFKSSEHDGRTTRRIVTHSKSKSAMDEFHRRHKSEQHDGRTTRLRHDRVRSRLDEIHRNVKSNLHDSRTTGIRRAVEGAVRPKQ